MGLLAFLLVGLVAGLVARALVPGRQSLGLLGTTLLGVVGSFIGGMFGSLINSGGDYLTLRPSGLIASILGAMVALVISGFATGRRGGGGARV